jgi:hypothetical protein
MARPRADGFPPPRCLGVEGRDRPERCPGQPHGRDDNASWRVEDRHSDPELISSTEIVPDSRNRVPRFFRRFDGFVHGLAGLRDTPGALSPGRGNQVRVRLAAGGRWIRTLGPALHTHRFGPCRELVRVGTYAGESHLDDVGCPAPLQPCRIRRDCSATRIARKVV